MNQQLLIKSLELLKNGHFKAGYQMEQAHEICQDYEGEPTFDWIHALVHRIEGDDGNAEYWYRRAGKYRHPGSVADEWQTIWDEVT
ncbi:hypothetical protein [Ruegeria arenilitoris]|uniref:hypothetical protein n=1 Tax=Ruegeria arenilitoris TaxID=1173585 RepID=UPI0014813CCA|nr:hypothetical protein [Ruegeria arenilitoris]